MAMLLIRIPLEHVSTLEKKRYDRGIGRATIEIESHDDDFEKF
jgi:hypothetical protein